VRGFTNDRGYLDEGTGAVSYLWHDLRPLAFMRLNIWDLGEVADALAVLPSCLLISQGAGSPRLNRRGLAVRDYVLCLSRNKMTTGGANSRGMKMKIG